MNTTRNPLKGTAMRTPVILSAVALIAIACGDATQPPVAPSSAARPAAEGVDVVALRIAVNDGLQRLLPGVSSDAAGAVGDALRSLDATLKSADLTSPALGTALADADQTLRRFSDADRADRATLDALALELSVVPRR
jgi:hypothetical protein